MKIGTACCLMFTGVLGAVEPYRLIDGAEKKTYDWVHPRFVEEQLADATDQHNELVFEKEYLLLRNEAPVTNAAPVVFLEDAMTGVGFAYVRLGPLPHARTDKTPDYILQPGRRTLFIQDTSYPMAEVAYTGGKPGRIAALQQLQRAIRPYRPERDGMFLSNTWGDGNRDACINEAFLLREVAAGAEVGVDVIQIDDGWQKGRTANSAAIKNRSEGRWASYWDQPGFWDVDPVRFPNGLAGIVGAARAKGMKFGLWFGPDSTNDAELWSRDADFILHLHKDLGIDYFKLDSMKSATPIALQRQRSLMDRLMKESERKITIDLDVTAGIRPGYYGFPDIGPVFVENRYARQKDSRLWWPHLTLRNLWSLAHVVDPLRLRMEVLNPDRKPECWGDDPLAPKAYPRDTLFAMVMAGSPLGWFEIQNLSLETVAAWKPLVATWKRERAAWHGGTIYPVAECPDGLSWTGFVSASANRASGYALLFRELNDRTSYLLDLRPYLKAGLSKAEVIAGRCTAVLSSEGTALTVTISSKLDFAWIKLN